MVEDEAGGVLGAASEPRASLGGRAHRAGGDTRHRHRRAKPRKSAKPRRRWRRVVLSLLALVLAVVIAWGIAGYVLLVKPSLSTPRHVDAVLVLGPPSANGRFDVGYQLVEEGYASTLVVSGPTPNLPRLKKLCHDGIANAKIICFQPEPRTTRGEAQKISELARRYHWKSIMVVTSTYHVSRARTVIQRCYSGTVLMQAARRGISLRDWAYQFAYQTGGYYRVITHQGC